MKWNALRFGLLLLLGFVAITPARAQTEALATVVSTCGTSPTGYTAGSPRPLTQDTNGDECISGFVQATQSGAWIITTSPGAVATTNDSGTIATGGTFQQIAAASTARKSFEFQNICNVGSNCNAVTDVCYLYIAASGVASTANSIAVSAGQYYLRSSGSIPSDIVDVTCTTTGDKFYAAVQ